MLWQTVERGGHSLLSGHAAVVLCVFALTTSNPWHYRSASSDFFNGQVGAV